MASGEEVKTSCLFDKKQGKKKGEQQCVRMSRMYEMSGPTMEAPVELQGQHHVILSKMTLRKHKI